MSQDIRSNGMRGWAAFCSVATIALWLFCAVLSFYKGERKPSSLRLSKYSRSTGVWQGKFFFAPGLQGWVEHKELEKQEGNEELRSEDNHANLRGVQTGRDAGNAMRRHPQPDGSYQRMRSSTDHDKV
jgi:hypothetical protein